MMNLFDVTKGIDTVFPPKPRAANEAEVKAYMQWQRDRHGLPEVEGCELHWRDHNTGRTRATAHRFCIGATFGTMTSGARWEGEGEGREYREAQYENGAYSVIMPGWNAHRQSITMETLDDAGEVVTSSTLPAEPKKGGVIWDRAAVRAAVGPIAKPAKASKRKAAPTVEANVPEIPAPVTAQEQSEPVAAPEGLERVEALSGLSVVILPSVDISADNSVSVAQVAATVSNLEKVGNSDLLDQQGEAMAAFIDTLETPTVRISTPTLITGQGAQKTETIVQNAPKRSPAHARLISRAWKERRESRLRRDIAADHERMREIAQDELRTATHWRDEYQTMANNALIAAHQAKARRRRAVLLARQRGKNMVAVYKVGRARIDEVQEDLRKARMAPTYFDDTGMERTDQAARAFDQGRHALEKSETLARQLSEARATIERQDKAIDKLAAEYESAALRAIKAERALAAIEARRDGNPPPVRVASVNFALAG